jgi:hypothetical protein
MKQLGATYEVQSAGRLGLGGPDTFSADSTTILINDASMLKVRDNILIGTDRCGSSAPKCWPPHDTSDGPKGQVSPL